MQFLPAHSILKFNPTILEDIRKCWNLENGRMEQSVTILEEWVSKQNHFINKEYSREYLEKTLVTCKGSVEKAKLQIDQLCTLKTLVPKFFIDGDIRKNLGEIVEIVYLAPLPKMTKDHCRAVIIRINPKDFTSAHYQSFYKLVTAICEYEKAHDYCNGFFIIDDFREANLMEILTKINLVELQQLTTVLTEGFGARLRGIHMLTQSKFIDLFVKAIKPFLSSKIAERIQVHQDFEELHRVVDKEILPIEYGGEERSIEILKNEWFDALCSEETEKYLAKMKASCTDESLRTSDMFNEQVMGLPGSFRTLNNLETELAKNVETLLRVETADLETVLNHYGITPESLSKMMKSIKEWYAKQAHLPQGHLHDRFILGHLMNRGFSVQRAKWNIDNFYTARRRMPELLSERNLADSSWLWYWQRFYFVLPKKTAENYRITLFRMDRECCDIIVTQVVKVALLRSEYRIWNDFALGDRWIIDLKHTTMQQALQLTPVLISKIIYFWKSCYSVKLASVHIINMPSYCATVFNLFKKGLNAKLTARIHIIKAEELLEIFPKDVLPKEYGGTEPSCQEIADEWVKTCQSEPWRKYLMEQDHILTDESKRLTKGKADEIFGVDGSFRQLNVD